MEYNFTFNKDDLKILEEAATKNGQSFLDYISDIKQNEENKTPKE